VQLLDVIFGQCDSVMAIEDHVHCVGIARYFLLVATGKGLGFHPGEQLLDFRITELGAFNTRGRSHAFNRCYPPEAGQPFGGKGFSDFPAPFEFIDILQYPFRGLLKRPSTPKAPTDSLPPLPLRLLPGGANQFPGGNFTRCGRTPFTAHRIMRGRHEESRTPDRPMT
jgi:hypothetical protein